MRVSRRREAVQALAPEPFLAPEPVTEPVEQEVLDAEPFVLPPVADPTTLDVVHELGQVHRNKVGEFFEAQMRAFKDSLVGQTFPNADWYGELKSEAFDYTKTEMVVTDLETGMMFLVDPDHYKLGKEGREYYNRYFGYVPRAKIEYGLGPRNYVHVNRTDTKIMIDSQESLERFCAYWQAAMERKEELEEKTGNRS